MTAFPTLMPEDMERFNTLLTDLLEQSGASTALVVEKAGFLIHECGERSRYDNTTVATLAANCFNAAEYMAMQLGETDFTTLKQQGALTNSLTLKLTDNALIVVIFPSNISMAVMSNFLRHVARQLANQIYVAMQRDPANLIDLADLNPTTASEVRQSLSQ